MTQATRDLDWSGYTAKLRRQGRIDLFVSEEAVAAWRFSGVRRPGGVVRYSERVIELCLVVREVFGLALRQAQGFVQSVLERLAPGLRAPDYTTLCRRAKRLKVCLALPKHFDRGHLGREHLDRGKGLVIAIDATGLSLHSTSPWHRFKHKAQSGQAGWRKLHVAVDTASGLVVSAAFGPANEPDHRRLDELVAAIQTPVQAACADMAYDKKPVRQTLQVRSIRQLIAPMRKARLSSENPNLARYAGVLAERDQAIAFIRQHASQLGWAGARALWKQATGYHARSQVETAFARLKTHTSHTLSNQREDTRQTQALIRCKAINMLACA